MSTDPIRILLATHKGYAIRFPESDARPMGRPAAGVKGVGLRKGDRVVAMEALSTDEDYGRIETPDNRVIYFHRNSVLKGSFDRLEIGSEVRFTEVSGEQGPQASSVTLVGKHHVVD